MASTSEATDAAAALAQTDNAMPNASDPIAFMVLLLCPSLGMPFGISAKSKAIEFPTKTPCRDDPRRRQLNAEVDFLFPLRALVGRKFRPRA
ncbi:hypothetical protein [Ensifer adhaerens]|uniref:hypothetical protein n=1 Tax=Ensifer adhaerens TaxID=106592 RepID=UPI0015EB6115|nr:hypothetical protein [Ensifer adhaerens]